LSDKEEQVHARQEVMERRGLTEMSRCIGEEAKEPIIQPMKLTLAIQVSVPGSSQPKLDQGSVSWGSTSAGHDSIAPCETPAKHTTRLERTRWVLSLTRPSPEPIVLFSPEKRSLTDLDVVLRSFFSTASVAAHK